MSSIKPEPERLSLIVKKHRQLNDNLEEKARQRRQSGEVSLSEINAELKRWTERQKARQGE